MQFEETFEFDQDTDTMVQLFCERTFYQTKYSRLGKRHSEILDSDLTDHVFSIRMRHDLDTSELPLPTFIGKRIGDRIELYQTDAWDTRTYSGQTDIKLHSGIVNVRIDMQLVDNKPGTRMLLTFDIRAHIAMFGSKLEQAVADAIARRMHKELEETARIAAARAA